MARIQIFDLLIRCWYLMLHMDSLCQVLIVLGTSHCLNTTNILFSSNAYTSYMPFKSFIPSKYCDSILYWHPLSCRRKFPKGMLGSFPSHEEAKFWCLRKATCMCHQERIKNFSSLWILGICMQVCLSESDMHAKFKKLVGWNSHYNYFLGLDKCLMNNSYCIHDVSLYSIA